MLKINLDRHGPEPYPNIWLLPDLPIFSLPTTFNNRIGFLQWIDKLVEIFS